MKTKVFIILILFSCNNRRFIILDKVYSHVNEPYTGVAKIESRSDKRSGNYTYLYIEDGIPVQIDYFENYNLLSTEIIKEVESNTLLPLNNSNIKSFLVFEKTMLPAIYKKDSLIFKLVYFGIEDISDTTVISHNIKNIVYNLTVEYNITDKKPYAWIGKNFYGAYIFNDSFDFMAKQLVEF